MRRMKCGGWFEQYRGDQASAVRIAVRMHPNLKPDWYKTHFAVYGDASVKFLTPTGQVLHAEPNQFVVCRMEPVFQITLTNISGKAIGGEELRRPCYYAMDHVPTDWLEPDDGLTPFTRTIMKDWMNYR